MTKPKATGPKGSVSRSEWQSHWSQLFDTGERDAAISAAGNAFFWMQNDAERHDPKVYASTLEKLICEPLTQYVKEIDSRKLRGVTEGQPAALNLMRVVYDVSEALTSRKLLPARVDYLLAEMHIKWDEFIIAGAASRMYHDIPIELERKGRNAAGGKKSAEQRRKITVSELKVKIAQFSKDGVTDKREINGKLARHFSVTPAAIRKARKQLSEKDT